MDTKKFKLGNSGATAKGGKNNTRTTLTAAGISAIGGAAAAAAAIHLDRKDDEELNTDETVAQNLEEENAENVEETAQQEQQAEDTHAETAQPQHNENITEPQPIDNGVNTTPEPQNPQSPSNNQANNTATENEGDVNPNDVAQAIAQEVDGGDNDADDVLTVDDFATVYGPDGSEMMVAVVHTPDGSQFLLADTDGDGIYSDVYDTEGNYVGNAEGNLTASDLVENYDTTGGYIAMRDNLDGDDPSQDMVNIDGSHPTQEDVAQNVTNDDDELTEEEQELLNDLLGGDIDEDIDDIEDHIVYPENEDPLDDDPGEEDDDPEEEDDDASSDYDQDASDEY